MNKFQRGTMLVHPIARPGGFPMLQTSSQIVIWHQAPNVIPCESEDTPNPDFPGSYYDEFSS